MKLERGKINHHARLSKAHEEATTATGRARPKENLSRKTLKRLHRKEQSTGRKATKKMQRTVNVQRSLKGETLRNHSEVLEQADVIRRDDAGRTRQERRD